MRTPIPRLIATTLIVLLACSTISATAAITRIAGPTTLFNEGRLFVKFDVAYDEVNKVYLVVWGTQGAGPTNGIFLNQSGAPITGPFAISEGPQQAGWARVAYSTQLGKFLVSYTKIMGGGNHQKAARFVQFVGGGPSMPAPEIILDSWNGNAASEAGIVYSPAAGKFIVSWWVWQPNPVPVSWIALVDAASNSATAPILVSEPSDGESDPRIACDQASNRCLVVGYSWGIINGGLNTVWGRLVNATTGAVIGGVFVIDGAALESEPTVAFNASSGKFVIGFVRDFKSVWSKTVSPTGALGAPITVSPTPILSTDGEGFGTINIINNPGTGTLMMSMLSWTALSIAQELDGNGAPIGGSTDRVPTDTGDWNQRGKYTVVAANVADKHFLLADNQRFTLARSALYSTQGGGPPPPSPPSGPLPLQVQSFAANVAMPVTEGTPITWTAATTGGTGPIQYQFVKFSESNGWTIGQAYSSSNTFTWFPTAGAHAVQVWVRSSGSGAAFEAFAESGMFNVNAPPPRVTGLAANVALPVPFNTPITWSATAAFAGGPVEYQFWLYSQSTGWRLGQDYSANRTFTWFPPMGLNAVQVWVRRAGSSVSLEDWMSSGLFTVQSTGAVLAGLSANVSFPTSPSTAITWTAIGTGGSGPLEYKFLAMDGSGAWSMIRDWATSNQVTWVPGVQHSGLSAVQAWVRTVGTLVNYESWRSSPLFNVTDITSVTLTPDRSLAGFRQGTMVTFTAQVTGGVGPWEYAFMTYDGTSWTLQRTYTSSNSFQWFPAIGTRALQVWVRAAGSRATYEAWQSTGVFVVNP